MELAIKLNTSIQLDVKSVIMIIFNVFMNDDLSILSSKQKGRHFSRLISGDT